MKKICFLILMFADMLTQSNALDLPELCTDFFNNRISSTPVHCYNGTSAAIDMAKVCQQYKYSSDSGINNPIANFSLVVFGTCIAVAIPCLQCIGGYAYRKINGYKSVEEEANNIRRLLDGNVGDEAPLAQDSILGRTVLTAQTVNNMNQNVENIQSVLGNLTNDGGENVLGDENKTVVTYLANMGGQIQEIRGILNEDEGVHNE